MAQDSNIDAAITEIAATYRSDFAYLSDHRFELLCASAAQNANQDESVSDDEFLSLFGASLEGFTNYTRQEIEEIC